METLNINMKNLVRSTVMVLLLITMFIPAYPAPVSAEAAPIGKPLPVYNLDYAQTTYLVTTEQGYMRVTYNEDTLSKILIEYFDADLKFTGRRYLKLELPIFGGFFKGTDGYYIVEGRNNKDCVDGTEVMRIIKYDTSWNRLGSGSILSGDEWDCEVRYPFKASNIDMTETESDLYVATGREAYVDPKIGQGHQGLIFIRMSKTSFDAEIIGADSWHSFAQHLTNDGNDLYLYERSEGSRATTLKHYDMSESGGEFNGAAKRCSVFNYGGVRVSAWSIPTYASAEDVALSSDNVLGIGVSIDQSKYDEHDRNEEEPYNIYLTVTPRSDISKEATTVKWLTSIKKPSYGVSSVFLTRINDDRFLVTWEEVGTEGKFADKGDWLSGHKLHYVFIDGDGNKISKVYTRRAAFSDCHPVISGDQAMFLASYMDCVDIYMINTENGDFSKKVYLTRMEDLDDVSYADINKIKDKTYTGNPITPVPVVKMGDKKLVQDKDYTVSYENNVSVGTAKIVIRGTGLYHNKYSKKFRIVPSGTTISRLSAGKKSLTVKWKKQTNQTSGYQIQCSTSKSFKKNTKTITVKSRNKASRTITGLKAKTGYYVRIRTYKVVDGKQYNSSWSSAKIKKTK